jgi:hypothetical protein
MSTVDDIRQAGATNYEGQSVCFMKTCFLCILTMTVLSNSMIGSQSAPAHRRQAASPSGLHDRNVAAVLKRLRQNSELFKVTLAGALDSSEINGTDLEDRLNEWADLLADEASRAVAEIPVTANVGIAGGQFGQHWANAMMAASGLNRAMLRRGFAPKAELEWAAIQSDVNHIANAVGQPPLPDIEALIFRMAPPAILTRQELREVMRELEGNADRFEDQFDRTPFDAVGAAQERVAERWINDLHAATAELLLEYRQNDAPAFQFKLEESLMLAAGVNRVLLLLRPSTVLLREWEQLLDRLNTLARSFAYPVVPFTR